MDISEIQDLIKFIAKAGVTEVEIEKKDFKITIKSEMPKKKGAAAEGTIQVPVPVAAMPQAPVAAVPPAATPAPAPAEGSEAPTANANEDNYITVKSPMIGTFYRRSAPDKPTFVEVGATVGNGDVLCVIEAMKLFNEIESEVSGKIIKILVDDNSPVEYDQPLFLVDPS